jgi:hypothetical protein
VQPFSQTGAQAAGAQALHSLVPASATAQKAKDNTHNVTKLIKLFITNLLGVTFAPTIQDKKGKNAQF